MFYGIRGRLVGTYLLIIILTVAICEAVIIWAVNTYYLESVSSIIKNQTEIAGNFYSSYLANTDIESNTGKLLNNFSRLPVQIQVIDRDQKVIADSLHVTYGSKLDYPDIRAALGGQQERFMGRDPNTGENVLSYSAPLKSGSEVVGAVRFTTSLQLTHKTVLRISALLITAGVVIILLIFLISLYISHTIIAPINKITRISDEMAKGNLSVRAEKVYDDEIGVLAESLNHMAVEIQKNEALKNEFISSISHELRTPLTSIKGWTMTLLETKPEESDIIARGTHIINNETDRLSDMVDELLDFSSLQSGKFSLHPEEVEINGLLRGVFEQMQQRASRQGITMKLNLSEKEQMLKLDKRRITQVLVNLFDNSFKFTPSGGSISLSAGIETSSQARHYAVTVEDTGCGISEQELPLIRNRFFRGKNAANTGGIGLGLAISSELIASHGGSLDIESTQGRGTAVTFRLPVKC